MTQFDSRDLITADGKYVVYYSSVGRSTTGENDVHYPRASLLTAMNKNNVLCVLTEAENYHKQLGVMAESTSEIDYYENRKFWLSPKGIFGSGFYNFETQAREFEIVQEEAFSGSSKCCWTISGNQFKWNSTLTAPPSGFLETYEMAGEQWNLTQTWNSVSNRALRVPPWSGELCKYVLTYAYSAYTKLNSLSTIEYVSDENRWVIKDTSGIILYECKNGPENYFDKTQTYHFDFIGELADTDDERIADGLDFSLNKEINLFGNENLDDFMSGDSLTSLKEIVADHKRKTGFNDIYIFDQPYFI